MILYSLLLILTKKNDALLTWNKNGIWNVQNTCIGNRRTEYLRMLPYMVLNQSCILTKIIIDKSVMIWRTQQYNFIKKNYVKEHFYDVTNRPNTKSILSYHFLKKRESILMWHNESLTKYICIKCLRVSWDTPRCICMLYRRVWREERFPNK